MGYKKALYFNDIELEIVKNSLKEYLCDSTRDKLGYHEGLILKVEQEQRERHESKKGLNDED